MCRPLCIAIVALRSIPVEATVARRLRRAIESYVEDSLSEQILRGNFRGKGLIKVTVGEDPDNPGEKKFKFEAFDAPPDSGDSDEVVAANADAT